MPQFEIHSNRRTEISRKGRKGGKKGRAGLKPAPTNPISFLRSLRPLRLIVRLRIFSYFVIFVPFVVNFPNPNPGAMNRAPTMQILPLRLCAFAGDFRIQIFFYLNCGMTFSANSRIFLSAISCGMPPK